MKKTISIILCIAMLIGLFAPSASAISFEAGPVLNRLAFKRGVGPEAGGYAIDYSYYSPIKKNGDTKLYPLVVLTAGLGEGAYKGAELEKNNFSLWASEELQSKFAFSKGAFILIARAPEEVFGGFGPYWNNSILIQGLHALIEDFCSRHPNIDTNRIYGIGWCFGSKGILNQEVNYPGTFAHMVLMVPNFVFSDKELEAMKDVNVWLVGSKTDSFSNFNLIIKPNWEALCKTKGKGTRLFTSYDKAINGNYLISHNVWDDASYDFDYPDKSAYRGRITVDENGNEIEFPSFISFISMTNAGSYELQHNGESDKGCMCRCHDNDFFGKIIWRLLYTLLQIFGLNDEYCECGARHYKSPVCETPEEIVETTTIPDDDEETDWEFFE